MKMHRWKKTGLLLLFSGVIIPLSAAVPEAKPSPSGNYGRENNIIHFADDGESCGSNGSFDFSGGRLRWSAQPAAEHHRWGAFRATPLLGGDVAVEAIFKIAALDHWNSFRLELAAPDQKRWSASISRTQENPGEEFLILSIRDGSREPVIHKVENHERSLSLRMERKNGKLLFSQCGNDGTSIPIGNFDCNYSGPVQIGINFDSPINTRHDVTLQKLRFHCSEQLPEVFSPTYNSMKKSSDGEILFTEATEREPDGTLRIAPNGRVIVAARCRPASRNWSFRFLSEGALKIKCILPGSAETLQLSDAVLWDDPDVQRGEGNAPVPRQVDLEQTVLRFPGERNWPLSHVTFSGIFFFEITPAGTESVRFRQPELHCRELHAPAPFPASATVSATEAAFRDSSGEFIALQWPVPAASQGFFSTMELPNPDEILRNTRPLFHYNPTLLSPRAPSVEIRIGQRAGALEILHAAGQQQPGDSEIAALYLIVYDDGTTEPAFATLRWNCGVFADGMIPEAAERGPDNTWWGPPRFGWAGAVYLPQKPYGATWHTLYRTELRNPAPEKVIRSLIVSQLPEDRREFLLAAVTVRTPEHTSFAVTEPECAVLTDGEAVGVNVYEYRACPVSDASYPFRMEKSAAAFQEFEPVTLHRSGPFGFGRTTFVPDSSELGPGPVTLRAGEIYSSRLSLMDRPSPDDRPFYYTMIAGGHEPYADFDRLKRLGYDAVKIHINWKLDADGNPDFSEWPERFERINRAGLSVAIRNLFQLPEAFRSEIPRTHLWKNGGETVNENIWDIDISNPVYRRKLVDYYRRVGELAAAAPNVMGINANYGQRNPIFENGALIYSDTSLAALRQYLAAHTSLDELNARTGLRLRSFAELTPQMIAEDRSGTLLPAYSRQNEETGSQLIRDIAEAIRSTGCDAHLTFNVNFHPIENKLSGQTFAEYLRVGMEYAPGSLFHETSERYTLSFVKYLAAARTCGLLYGDECCQPPPSYEHLMFAYLWMGMMQCFESNYCQWWGGKPATQNIAQLKAYHKLLCNAEYLPDPVTLALSLETGHEETPSTAAVPLHTRPASHYGLANLLRELNINADRYMIDEFPQLDANVKSRLLIDDHSRWMPKSFGDRIERFIRNGGTFLASLETDVLNDYAFFRRFGIEDVKQLSGGDFPLPIFEQDVGRGKLAIFLGNYAAGWDPGRPEEKRRNWREIMTRLGEFQPLVSSSFANLFVTPYRSKNGDVLISCINITAAAQTAEIDFSEGLLPQDEFRVLDLGTGLELPPRRKDGRVTVNVTLPAINSTVLRITGK